MTAEPTNTGEGIPVRHDGTLGRVLLPARWTLADSAALNAIDRIGARIVAEFEADVPVVLDASAVVAMDTAGALVLARLVDGLRSTGRPVRLDGLARHHESLLGLVESNRQGPPPAPLRPRALERFGTGTENLLRNTVGFLSFLGHVFVSSAGALFRPRQIRGALVLRNLQTAGADALPIVGLLSLLVGIVIAYQGAIQLHRYGADIFIVDLVGLSLLREIAPLITAIIVAGRTGAAYTARIGTMRVTEEVDALQVMGLSPVDVLVRPKVYALLIALPLLTVYADIVGIAGGVLMTAATTSIGPAFFLEQLPRVIPVESFLVGVGKAPVFALVIASVGCWQGFQASESAESVGSRTTLSVVQSVFLIIVLDAAFSVVFSIVGI
ncbi:MlaE family lipid ABC transporter permease subunit [bacterium]|nr:MlaE family lipid ABC transporter permease subunit [bacterium]